DYEVQITDDNVVPPIFTTRELSSNLQVENGQTLVLGGLIQREDQKVKGGIPLLRRLPLIGWIFGQTQIVQKESEILMILTPYVVDTREETDLLTKEFSTKIMSAKSEEDIRTLYHLENTEYAAPTAKRFAKKPKPVEEIPAVEPEAEGN
ncbi:MAG: type II secretion system protein GspD, partial [Kiritimatiellales bacterium]